jgi:hypothetical protein
MVKKKEETNIQNPLGLVGKYTLRSTGEEVEVIASNLVENGARSDDDWVTYIDSIGKEHIKEHLSIQLDFKVSPELPDVFKKIFEPVKTEFPKFPSTKNTRLFDTVKQLVVERKFSVEKAVAKAKEIVEAVNDIYEDHESGQTN